jgi:outer membrane protein assembly factor BamB
MPHCLRSKPLKIASLAAGAVALSLVACSRSALDELLDDGTGGHYLPDGAWVPAPQDDGGTGDDVGPDGSDLPDTNPVRLPDGQVIYPEGGTHVGNPGGEGGGPPPPPKDVCGEYVFQVGSPWPSLQRCPFHWGRTDVRGPKNPVQKWSVLSPMGAVFQWPFEFFGGGPTIAANGMIYLTLATGSVEAISSDGVVQWTTGLTSTGWYAGSPSVAIARDGTLYVALDSIYALDPAGRLQWTRGFKYVGGTDRTCVGYSPAIGPDGNVYSAGWRSLTSVSSGFFAVTHTGTDVWNDPTLDMVSDFAIGQDGTVFVGDTSGQLIAVDPSGTRKWSFAVGDTSTQVRMTSTIGPDGVSYIGATMDSSVNTLYAVNPDGSEKWRRQIAESTYPMAGSPALGADGTLYMIDAVGSLNAIDANGAPLWTFATTNLPETSVSNAPIIDGAGVVYFVTSSVYDARSTLYAVDRNGQLVWSMPLGGFANGAPALGANGTLYVATSSALYAIGD